MVNKTGFIYGGAWQSMYYYIKRELARFLYQQATPGWVLYNVKESAGVEKLIEKDRNKERIMWEMNVKQN